MSEMIKNGGTCWYDLFDLGKDFGTERMKKKKIEGFKTAVAAEKFLGSHITKEVYSNARNN